MGNLAGWRRWEEVKRWRGGERERGGGERESEWFVDYGKVEM